MNLTIAQRLAPDGAEPAVQIEYFYATLAALYAPSSPVHTWNTHSGGKLFHTRGIQRIIGRIVCRGLKEPKPAPKRQRLRVTGRVVPGGPPPGWYIIRQISLLTGWNGTTVRQQVAKALEAGLITPVGYIAADRRVRIHYEAARLPGFTDACARRGVQIDESSAS